MEYNFNKLEKYYKNKKMLLVFAIGVIILLVENSIDVHGINDR